MRYIELSDFTRSANIANIMSNIATFKIPKGMVYAFSTRLNLSIYVTEIETKEAVSTTTCTALTSDHSHCADLGADLLECSVLPSIVLWKTGVVYKTLDDWTIVDATEVITLAASAAGAYVDKCYVSTLNGTPNTAAPAILEIRAESPAAQNIGIPIFSGLLDEIHKQTQKGDLTPLRLHGAVLLPEGFVLAVKVNAVSTCSAGTEVLDTTGLKVSDDPYDPTRLRIPYERMALRDFPRDFKARVLASMATS